MPKRTKFPLPKTVLPTIQLTNHEAQKYEQLAKTLVEKCIQEYEQSHQLASASSNWQVYKTRETMTLYQATTSASESASAVSMRLSGSMIGDLSDLMYAVVNPTDEATRLKASYMQDDTVDGAVLSTIVPASVHEPFRFVGIKWMVKTPSAPSAMLPFVRKRDFVFVESTGTLVNAVGERIGYHLMHSIHLPTLDQNQQMLQTEYDIVRGQLSVCSLYKQVAGTTGAGAGILELYQTASLDLNGDLLDAIASATCANLLLTNAKLVHCAKMKKLAWLLHQSSNMNMALPDSASTTAASACAICYTAFHSMWNRSSSCRICYQVVCRRCLFVRHVSLERPDLHVVQQRLECCSTCMNIANQENAELIASQEILQGSTTGAFRPDHDRLSLLNGRWKSSGSTATMSSSISSFPQPFDYEIENQSPPSSSFPVQYLL